jgi:hypothetical protein
LGGYCEYVNKTVELQDWQEVVYSDEGMTDSQVELGPCRLVKFTIYRPIASV